MVPILKQYTRYIILVVAGIMYASAVGFSVLHQTGFVGATKKQSPPLGCICHGNNEPTPTVNVWISGPETVIVGTTTHYTVSMIGGPAIAGGYNVAAMRGGLSPADTTSVLLATVDGLELTHANPKRFVSDTVRWEFTYQAPANPGQDTLFCAGNSVDFDGTPVGDQYNFGNDFIVSLIESPAGVNEDQHPLAFVIFQNYPNPFNPSTTIRFRLDHESSVELAVYNVYIMKRQPRIVSCDGLVHKTYNKHMEVAMSTYDYEIGFDLHKDFSMLALVNSQGKCISYDRIENIPEHLDQYFSGIDGSFRVTFESTRNWYWLADYFQERNIPFILSNPALNRAIAHIHAKNDKYDARTLAQLTRADLIAQCYVPTKDIRTLRELLFHRQRLLHIRTKLKNRIHVTLAKYNFRAPYNYIFGPNGIKWIESCPLPNPMNQIVTELLTIIAELNPRIEFYHDRIKERVEQRPDYKILSSVYGFGVIHSATIIARIADISRFPTIEGFTRYSGLAVNTRASADKITYGHLNRQSDKYLRTTFVEAAYLVIRHDPGLRAFYEYLRAQKGHGCAICAVARKLARSVYWMLKNSTPYRLRRIQPQYVPKPGAKLTIRRLAHSPTTA